MAAIDVWTIERGPEWPPGLGCLDHAVEGGNAAAAGGAPQRLHGLGRRGLVATLEPQAAVTIVGARRCTEEGERIAEEMASALAAAGLVVISGMAFGIDSAAHRGALAAKGPTVAVLAGGPDVPYPPSARRLYARILSEGGAVISEMEPGRRAERWGFPARNRIMAALSTITVVVEAANPSGSRITADKALELGREVGAVPGSIFAPLSRGPHELIRDGAHLIRGAQDVLDLVLGVGVRDAMRIGPPVDPTLALVLEGVGPTGSSSERLAAGLEISASSVAVALSRLELLGYLRSHAGTVVRTGLEPPPAP